jgi:hypothetical protein
MGRAAHAAVRRGDDPGRVNVLNLALLASSLLLVAGMISALVAGLAAPSTREAFAARRAAKRPL